MRIRAAIRGNPQSAQVLAIRSTNRRTASSSRRPGDMPPLYNIHGVHKFVKTVYVGAMSDVIEVVDLVKTFGTTRALDGLELTVRSGEVHGFLGPNGAGKSTTIRVLLGLLRADAGQVRLLDGDPWRDAVALHRRLAYVPGDVTLWPNLTGGEVIDLLGRLRGRLNET